MEHEGTQLRCLSKIKPVHIALVLILPSSQAVAGEFEARTRILLRSISLKVVPELDLILRAARAAARPL